MLKTEKIKKQINVLPLDLLNEVERFIGSLKASRKAPAKRSSLLTDLSECAAIVNLPEDFSKQHDHYLYGLPNKGDGQETHIVMRYKRTKGELIFAKIKKY